MARYSTQGPQMAILAVIAAGVAGFFYGHSRGEDSNRDQVARLLRQDQVSEQCRQQITNAANAVFEYEDAKNEAFRGYSRY